MTLERDLTTHILDIARDLTDPNVGTFAVPRAEIVAFARVMEQDDTDTFAIVYRGSLDLLREALVTHDRLPMARARRTVREMMGAILGIGARANDWQGPTDDGRTTGDEQS